MPYGLFDYVPDNTIHTMGLSPAYQPAQQFRDNVTGQIVDRSVLESKAVFYGGNMTPAQQEAKAKQLAQEISTRYTPMPLSPPASSVNKSSGGSTNPYTRAIPEGPTQQLMTDGFVGAEGPGPFKPPMTLAAICGEDPKFCRPVTMAIPEDPTQIIKPPTQQGQCPPGYGGPSPQPPRVAPIEEQIRMPIKSPITLMVGETTGIGLDAGPRFYQGNINDLGFGAAPAQGWGMSNTLPSR